MTFDQMLTVLESGEIDEHKLHLFASMLRTAIARRGDPLGRGAKMLTIIGDRLRKVR
jgi:hypothetical protein